jgi:hypothetical protein
LQTRHVEVDATLDAAEVTFLRSLIVSGFVLRVGVALMLEWTGFSARLAPDEGTYQDHGWVMALYWSGDLLAKPWKFTLDIPLGYFYLNAIFFRLFGQTTIPIKIMNCFVGAASCRYIYLLSRGLYGRSVARRASILFQYFPSLVLWSAVNIRDVWVLFLIIFISWKSLQLLRKYSNSTLLSMLAAMFALTLFRDHLFYVVAAPPIVAFLIGRRGNLVRNFAIASLTSIGVLLLLQQGTITGETHSRMSLEAVSKMRQDLAGGSSAFEKNVDISTPAKALVFLPVGIAYYLFSPFPWQITSLLKLFSVPEMLLTYYLTPAILRGIRYTLRERFREALQVLLITALITVIYALGEGNVGTLYRHRAQSQGFYLMFAAAGLEVRRSAAAHRTLAARPA